MTASRVARRDVHIVEVDEDTGEKIIHHFTAGEEVPGELVELTDNPSIWQGETQFSPGNMPKTLNRPTDGLEAMSVQKLLQFCKDNDIDVKGTTKKNEILDIIREAQGEA